MTRDQNFLLRNIPENKLENVYSFLKEILPSVKLPLLFAKALSCAGASTCQLGICLSRQAAKAMIKTLAASELDLDKVGDIRLNISGCPNACGHHPSADLGFSGKISRKDAHVYPSYSVYAGAVIHDGKTKLAQLVGDVPAKALPFLVKDILASYIAKSAQFGSFRDYIAAEGKEDLRQVILRYKNVPAFEDDKNYYFDWGADKVFSLAGRGTGECSAGLFDLIEMDLGNIRESRKKLSFAAAEEKARILRDIVLYSSRMLLITRGVEPKSNHEVYEAMAKHFIETGLVDASYANLLGHAKAGDFQALSDNESAVYGLAQAVESLYENMDNGFNFRKPGLPGDKDKTLAKPVGPVVVKDLRGVLCPLNFVKTKVELSQIKSGDILEVWLDDGAPIENVPGSVKAEGHKIIEQKKNGDYWSVVIEKK
jgi:sulfite reductase (ferredoxin)